MHAFRTAASLIVACLLLAGCGGGPESTVVAEPLPDADSTTGEDVPVPASTAGVGPVVDVAGAVRRPGVYRMDPGARVHEAIEAAGGATARADLSTLNRASVLVDGQQVVVARAGEAASPPGSSAVASGAGGGSVSINVADVAALDTLPGIGPVTAERIVAEREAGGPFRDVDDLDRVPGIGPATIESLRDVVTA